MNEAGVDLKRMAPRGQGDLPDIRDVKTTQIYNTVSPDQFLERILNLPDSELVLIEPRMELLLRQENPESLILQLEEMKNSSEDLVFHRILPIQTKTRHQGNLLDRELEAERGLMLGSPVQKSGSGPPLSDIVFFRYTRYLTIFHLMQYYRDIFTIFSKCKLGQNAPKFHSWSAYVEIFLTKWRIC